MTGPERDQMLVEIHTLLLTIGHELADSGTQRPESLRALLRRLDPQPVTRIGDVSQHYQSDMAGRI